MVGLNDGGIPLGTRQGTNELVVELDPYQTRPKELLMLEVDPIKRPMKLAEVAPKGLVPVLKLTHSPTRTLHESTVILDYLEE